MVVPRAGTYQEIHGWAPSNPLGGRYMWESGARLLRAGWGRPRGGRMPTAALRASMARSAAGSLRDRRTGRGPLSRLAGTRAGTLGARVYAAAESSPPRPRAELAPATVEASIDCFDKQPRISRGSRWKLYVIQTAES